MTVAELIAELQKFPPETVVLIDSFPQDWVPSAVISRAVLKSDFTLMDVPAPCTVACIS